MPHSLDSAFSRLQTLATSTGARLTTQVQLELHGGAILITHWDPPGEDPILSLPKETHLYFSADRAEGAFQWAFVYDAVRYLWSIEQGLTDQQAEDEARRMVETVGAVEDYLMGRPYTFVMRRGHSQSVVDKGR